MELLNRYAPMMIKYIRANNAPFMTKLLSKAIMNRSRLKINLLKIAVRIMSINTKNNEITASIW